MNQHQRMVLEFHKKFGHPAPALATIEGFRTKLRIDLIKSEAEEFEKAANAGDWVEMIDAICDILYVTYGAAIEMGVDIYPFFAEVHRTNMLKVGGATRADGKTLKPEGWLPPRIAELLEQLRVTGSAELPEPPLLSYTYGVLPPRETFIERFSTVMLGAPFELEHLPEATAAILRKLTAAPGVEIREFTRERQPGNQLVTVFAIDTAESMYELLTRVTAGLRLGEDDSIEWCRSLGDDGEESSERATALDLMSCALGTLEIEWV